MRMYTGYNIIDFNLQSKVLSYLCRFAVPTENNKCEEPENSVRGGGGGCLDNFFSVINVFYRGPYGPPSRSNWT